MGTIKIIKNPTQDVYISLKRLTNGTCFYPGCDEQAETVVSILRHKWDKPCFENSIILCNNHALLSQQGEINESMLTDIRELFRVSRAMDDKAKGYNIPTREEYLSKVVEKVSDSTTVRCVYVGPLPFHPEWYFNLKEGMTRMDSMDRAISRALEDPNINVKIIVRNDERYLEKIKSDVPANLVPELIREICEKYEKLTDDSYINTIIFWDLGFYHIPIILDDSCIFAYRGQPRSPVEGGFFTEDAEKIQWKKNTFDQLIDMHKNKKGNISDLKKFLENLLI